MGTNERNIDYLNSVFDRQIKQESDKSISYISKQIFNLTLNFTIQDWYMIRDKEYYYFMDNNLNLYVRKEYKLNKIKAYLCIK